MTNWQKVTFRGHRLAIAGRVVEAQTGRAIAGAQVHINVAPLAFTSWLAVRSIQHGDQWETLTERPDRTLSRPDGTFRFLDLPDGRYTLNVAWPAAGKRYGTAELQSTVPPPSGAPFIPEVALPSTTLAGTVSDAAGKPILMASLIVLGTGEEAFTNDQGRYLLVGLEPGERNVQVTARGYQTGLQSASLSQGQVQTLNLTLVRAPP